MSDSNSDHRGWRWSFVSHSLVTQLWSSLPFRSSSSKPRACRASCSFFLWRGCLMLSSCRGKQKNTEKGNNHSSSVFLQIKLYYSIWFVKNFTGSPPTFSRSCCEACSNVCPDLTQFCPWAAYNPRPCSCNHEQTSSLLQRENGASPALNKH